MYPGHVNRMLWENEIQRALRAPGGGTSHRASPLEAPAPPSSIQGEGVPLKLHILRAASEGALLS